MPNTIGFVKIFIFATLLFFLFATPAHAQVVLSEVYPAPTSEEKEWIEFFNTTAEIVDISGWKLFEHFSSKNELVTFSDTHIEPHSYFIFELPTNKLNNTEEKITLENNIATEISAVHYTNSESQKSFSFLFQSETVIGKILQLGTPTKKTINPLEPIITPQPTTTPQLTPTPVPIETSKTQEQKSQAVNTGPATEAPQPLSALNQSNAEPTINPNLQQYRTVSSQLKLPKLGKTEKNGLIKREPQLSYIVQKKVSKAGVMSAIIGGTILLFIGFLL